MSFWQYILSVILDSKVTKKNNNNIKDDVTTDREKKKKRGLVFTSQELKHQAENSLVEPQRSCVLLMIHTVPQHCTRSQRHSEP